MPVAASQRSLWSVFVAPFRAIRIACATLLLAAVTAGCAVDQDGNTVTIIDDVAVLNRSAEGLDPVSARQLQRVQRYARMRAQGAAGGALAGLLTGLLIADNKAAGAGVGAVAGAQIGYLAGAYIANLNTVAEDRRGDLNAQLQAARASVAETRSAVRDNRKMVNAERNAIRRLNRRYAAGKVTQEQYRSQIAELETKQIILNDTIRIAQNDSTAIAHTIEAQKAAGANTRRLANEQARLQAEIRRLNQQRDRLVTAVASIPPEIGYPAA